MIDEALKYARLGLSVIPLVKGYKFPPKGITWKNRQITRATEPEIRQWWKDHPTCNIGVVTGRVSGLDVLDFDSDEDLERFQATVCEIPETIKQTTGRGLHACFEYHGGGKGIVTDSRYGGMMDVRTDGGIFVVAPSIHKSGKRYQWLNIDPLEMGLDDLLPMPKEIVEFLAECKAKQPSKDRVDPGQWFKNGIPEGRKHTDLFRYACQKIHQGLAYDEVLILTTELARRCRPLPNDGPERAALDRVEQAFSKYSNTNIGDPQHVETKRANVSFI